MNNYEYEWVTCPECKGQGHWFDGVSIRICPSCSNEGEVKQLRRTKKQDGESDD